MKYTCPCGLEKTCKHPFFKVDGNKHPRILVVGEAPGQTEDIRGHLFVGSAGKLLRSTLEGCGVNLNDVGYCNVLGCRPPGNVAPSASQMESCSANLQENIASVKDTAKLILLMGNTALRAVLGKAGITKYSGSVAGEIGDALVIPIFHPAYVLRNMHTRLERFVSDLEFAISRLGGTSPLDKIPGKTVDSKYLEDHLDEIRNTDLLSFDTETTNLDGFSKEGGLLGIGLCWSDKDVVFVPLFHPEATHTRKECHKKLNLLKILLEDDSIPKVAQNAKFDTTYLFAQAGINVATVASDTMLAHHLLDENSLHNLSFLTATYLPEYNGYDGEMKFLRAETNEHMEDIPLENIAPYCCGDAFVTRKLHYILLEKLKEENLLSLYQDVVMPANYVYTKMAKAGVAVDSKCGLHIKQAYQDYIKVLEDKIQELPLVKEDWVAFQEVELGIVALKESFKLEACPRWRKCKNLVRGVKHSDVPKGIERNQDERLCFGWMYSKLYPQCIGFNNLSEYRQKLLYTKLEKLKRQTKLNPNSYPQLSQLLYKVGGFPVQLNYKTGNPTTDKEARKELLKHTDSQYKKGLIFVRLFEDYSKIQSINKTFASKWESWISDDGLIHANMLQHGTVTGRLAFRKPNLQNMPKVIENLGDEVTEWMSRHNIKSLFASKFEGGLIVNADFSQIELRVMASLSGDPTMVEAYQTGRDLHVVTAKNLFPDYDLKFPEEQRKMRDIAKTYNFASIYSLTPKFMEMYPGLGEWVKETIAFLETHEYTENIFHRRRRLPEIRGILDKYEKKHVIQQGVNSCVQGGAHDIETLALIRVNKEFERLNLKSHIIFEVHDNVVVDTHPEEVDIVCRILYDKMTEENVLDVPLTVEVTVGKNWGDQRKVENAYGKS